ncbi:MAG: DMP19 family protein [Pseudomonadales bacterium]|nr:DMP19 family protein [Pseudomonadales bacterium]
MSVSNAAVDAVFAKYAKKDVDIQSLAEPDRSVILSISAQGIIDSGGFITFFEDDIQEGVDYQWFVDAYRNIGIEPLASNFSEILSLFPEGKPQVDLGERQNHLARFFDDESPEYINILGALENAFFDNNGSVYAAAEACIAAKS